MFAGTVGGTAHVGGGRWCRGSGGWFRGTDGFWMQGRVWLLNVWHVCESNQNSYRGGRMSKGVGIDSRCGRSRPHDTTA